MDIVHNLKSIREQKGITVRELSEKTGISFQSISKIENGRYNTGIDSICKIADALGCKVEIISE